MKPSAVQARLKRAGVSVVCHPPASLPKELHPALDADPGLRTIPVTNQGAAICGGVFLSGKRPALGATSPHLAAAKVEAVAQPRLKRKYGDSRKDKYVLVRHVKATKGVSSASV